MVGGVRFGESMHGSQGVFSPGEVSSGVTGYVEQRFGMSVCGEFRKGLVWQSWYGTVRWGWPR